MPKASALAGLTGRKRPLTGVGAEETCYPKRRCGHSCAVARPKPWARAREWDDDADRHIGAKKMRSEGAVGWSYARIRLYVESHCDWDAAWKDVLHAITTDILCRHEPIVPSHDGHWASYIS